MTSAPERFALLPVSRPIFPEIALLLKANIYGMRIVRPSQNAKNFQREVTVLTYQNPKERRTPHTSLKQICTLPSGTYNYVQNTFFNTLKALAARQQSVTLLCGDGTSLLLSGDTTKAITTQSQLIKLDADNISCAIRFFLSSPNATKLGSKLDDRI
jgi:hypothetical protein